MTAPTSRHRRTMKTALTLAVLLLALAPAVTPALAVSRKRPASPVQTQPAAVNEKPLTGPQIYQRLVHASGYVLAPQQGEESTFTGTAWLVDREQRLMVTNAHVVGDAERVEIVFADFEEGRLITDRVHYTQHARRVPARVLDADSDLDLTLIQVDSLPDHAVPLPLADKSLSGGETVHTMGGRPAGSGGFWIYVHGSVRGVYDGKNVLGGYAYILEHDMSTNGGNSGGPIVDDHARLVGVHEGSARMDGGREVRGVSFGLDLMTVREWLETVLPLVDPQTAEDFNFRGVRHIDQGRIDPAIRDFSRAIDLDPKLAYAWYNRSYSFLMAEDYRSALLDSNDMLKLDPTDVDGLQIRGAAYAGLKEYEKAIADYTNAIRFAADGGSLHDAYYLRGKAYYNAGRHEEALADLNRSIELAAREYDRLDAPQTVMDEADVEYLTYRIEDYLVGRGEIYRELDRNDEAVADFQLAVKLAPEKAAVHHNLGYQLYQMERNEEALAAHSTAIELDGEVELYHWYRAQELLALDQAQAAAEEFAVCCKLAPQDDANWNMLAVSAYRLENYELAAKAETEAIRLAPNNALYHANRGEDYALLGQNEAAAADYAKAAELDPETYVHRFRKYFQFENKTGQEVRLHVQYYTKTTDGSYAWFTADNYWTFADGETATLLDGEFKINAYKVRFWVVGNKTGFQYDKYRNQDLALVPAGAGYLGSPDSDYQVFTFTLSP